MALVESKEVLDVGWFKAGADLSTHSKKFVELTALNTVGLVNAVTDRPFGVLMNKPVADAAAEVRVLGIAIVISDGSGTAIVVGDYVGPNATGLAIKKATADNVVAGIALDASSANGTWIRVLLLPGAFFRTAA